MENNIGVRRIVFLVVPLIIAVLTAIASLTLMLLGDASTALVCGSITALLIIISLIMLIVMIIVPMNAMVAYRNQLVERKVEPLVSAVTQISMGNLTTRIKKDAIGVKLPQMAYQTGLDTLFTGISSKIDEGIDDYKGITGEPVRRLCFVGNNSYQEGCLAARETGKLIGGRGQVAIILPRMKDINHSFRVKGFTNIMRNEFPRITIVATAENLLSGDMRENSRNIVSNWCKEFPDLDVIYLTEGYTPIVCAQIIMAKTGKKPKIVAYDLWEDNIAGMELGPIEILLDQDAFSQGYQPVINLYNFLEFGTRPVFPKQTLEPLVVTKATLNEIWDKSRKTRKVSSSMLANLPQLAKRKTNNKFKIGFLIPQNTQIWSAIIDGVHEAKKRLSPLGVEVEICDLSQKQYTSSWGSVDWYTPDLNRLEKEHVRGIALNIIDRDLIPVLNEMSEHGMHFATYNSEPFNFREIIITIFEGLSALTLHSETLAAAANESSRSTDLINATMQSIVADTQTQSNEVKRTDQLMQGLSKTINELVEIIDSVSSAVNQSANLAREGGQAVESSTKATESLLDSYRSLETQVADLREKIDRIGNMVELIEGFAGETNVLAINAAIQAARAGEQGKGFAVVAASVRNLAESSRKTAADIKTILQTAQESMDSATTMVHKGSEKVGTNLSLAQKAQSSLNVVMDTNKVAHERIQAINKGVESLEQAGNQVRMAMSTLEETISKNSTRVEEISGSTSEMTVQENELSRTAADLLSLAHDQEMLLNQLSFRKKID